MSITTYSELQAGVKRWLHRGDLDALIPDFITLGEARINRLLNLPIQQASVTINPSTTVRYVALPTRFGELLSFTDDEGDPVQAVTAGQLEAAADDAIAGRPAYYRITSRIDFERVADATYDFTMVYRQRLDVTADGTNTILTTYPDIYLYASLLSAAPYIKDDARIAIWDQMMSAAVTEANATVRGHVMRRTELVAEGAFDIRTG